MTKRKASLRARLGNTFLTGILFLLPTAISIWVAKIVFVQAGKVSRPWVRRFFEAVHPELDLPMLESIVAALLTLLFILAIGFLAKSFIGRRLLHFFEKLFLQIPLLKTIYMAVKQLVEAFNMQDKESFDAVITFEYPRRGLWCIGFVTKDVQVEGIDQEELVAVFVPTTPNPTSGVMVMAPRKEIYPLDMTVEEGIKLVVSAGMVNRPMRVLGNGSKTEGMNTP